MKRCLVTLNGKRPIPTSDWATQLAALRMICSASIRFSALLRLLICLVGIHACPIQAKEFLLRPEDVTGMGTSNSQMAWQRQVLPGDIITFLGGSYQGNLILSLQGTAAQPIIIRANSDQPSFIEGGLSLSRSAWVIVDGLSIRNTEQAGIAVREGSHHITIQNNNILGTGLGIWIGAAAGGNLLIQKNTIGSSQTHGIAIDKVNLNAGEETVISNNRIFDNQHHGIEINGNRYIIENNEVFRNGRGLPGTSGIHCFVTDAGEGTGRYNIIRNNVTWGQKDRAGPDGNGIQLDRWCDYNKVYNNIAYDNDGAGINIFHAAHNEIYNNTLVRNMKDIERSHEPKLKGDLVIVNDRDQSPRMDNVFVSNNLVVSRHHGVVPMVLDAATVNKVRFKNNQFYHDNESTRIRIGTNESGDANEINRTSGSAGNSFAAPDFKVPNPIKRDDFVIRNIGMVGSPQHPVGALVP
jgi:parallel beta-helix repeat protein